MANERLCKVALVIWTVVSVWCKVDATCDFNSYAEYKDDYEQKYARESQTLYPYGTTYCDSDINSDQRRAGGLDLDISFTIPFFGSSFQSAWASVDGFVSLERTDSARGYSYFLVSSWPHPLYPNNPDPPFIGPFYSESEMLSETDGDLFHRVLDLDNDPDEISQGMLSDISADVNSAVVGPGGFKARAGIIATWHLVTFKGASCLATTQTCIRNTYQVAIVTDGTETYAVFNYYDINWTGGAGYQRCDATTGSTGAECEHAHAGFNAGDGRGFTALPYSHSIKMKDIDENGGSDIPGRFYYLISPDRPVRGGCTTDTSLTNAEWPLEIYPRHGDMFGGQDVQFSGPCYTQEVIESSKCMFSDITSETKSDNLMRVSCVAPMMAEVGIIKVAISVSGGTSYKINTEYVVEPYGRQSPKVTLNNAGDWLNTDRLTLSWNPADLSDLPDVDIKLLGYTETRTSSSLKSEWETLYTYETSYSNGGSYVLVTADHICEEVKCGNYLQGAIQVMVTGTSSNNPRAVWSAVIPLGWFAKHVQESRYTTSWIERACKEWYSQDNASPVWKTNLQPCPCTVHQAQADFGQFQPLAECASGSGHTSCDMHDSAVNCFVSTQVYGTEGNGMMCCYKNGGGGELMYAADSKAGSTSNRGHPWGLYPYREVPQIPTLSHWVSDVTPYHLCCEWQENEEDCFSKYMNARPTTGCKSYQSAGHAIAHGDPHFTTFDGVEYTFNGHGEYVLMNAEDGDIKIQLQVRMEQPPEPTDGSDGEIKATMISAVGMALENGEAVVIAINRYSAEHHLLVYIDDLLLDFTQHGSTWHETEDFIIINTSGGVSESFEVIFRCGVGVRAEYLHGMMQLVISISARFNDTSGSGQQKTRGLLGIWNGDPSDDLTPSDGTVFKSSTGNHTEALHKEFGLTWVVPSTTASLFSVLYVGQLNYDHFRQDGFVPHYQPTIPEGAALDEAQVTATCGADFACSYDYSVLVSQQAGEDVLTIKNERQNMVDMAEPVMSCGLLSVEMAIKQEPYSYLVGSTVILLGCRDDYNLIGHDEYHCVEESGTGRWNPDVTSYCDMKGSSLSTASIVGISVGVAILAILIIIGIIILILVIRKRRKEKKESEKRPEDFGDLTVFNQPPEPVITYTKPSNRPSRAPLKGKDEAYRTQRDHSHTDTTSASSVPVGRHELSQSSTDIAAGAHRTHTPNATLNNSWDSFEMPAPRPTYPSTTRHPHQPPPQQQQQQQPQDMYSHNPGYNATSSDDLDFQNYPMPKRKAPYSYPNMPPEPTPQAEQQQEASQKDGKQKKNKSPKKEKTAKQQPPSIQHKPTRDPTTTMATEGSGAGQVSKYYQARYGNRYGKYS